MRNSGGGHVNHSLFWTLMAPNAGGAPARILRHLGLPPEPPVPRPARAPPLVDGFPGVTGADDDR